jgi:hypothetical protein
MPAFIVRCVRCNAQIWVATQPDLFAMRQECLAKSIMIRRYKADQAFRRSPVIYPYVVGMVWRN